MAWLLAVVAAGASFLLLPGEDVGFDRYHLPKECWAAGGAALALGVAARRRLALDGLNAAAAALALLCVAATAAALSVPLAARAASLTLSALVLFVVARQADARERQLVATALVAIACAVAALALLETFGRLELSQLGRAPGATVGQRNAVAHLLLLAAPAALTLSLAATSRWARAALVLAAALIAAGIVVTRCRSAWLAGPVVALTWLAVTRERTAVHRVLPLVAVAMAVAVVGLAHPRLHWVAAHPYLDTLERLTDSSTGSGRGRLTQYRASLELVARHPLLGVGPANWAVGYPTVSPPGDPTFRADAWLPTNRLLVSDALALLVECGPLAWAAALAFGALLARRRASAPTLAALAVVGSLDAVLQTPASAVCAALLLGVAAPASEDARGAPPWLNAAVAGVLAAAALAAGARVIGTSYRLGGGFENLERAVEWYPSDLNTRTELAEAWLLESGCDRARPHLAVLVQLLPYHPVVLAQARACGVVR